MGGDGKVPRLRRAVTLSQAHASIRAIIALKKPRPNSKTANPPKAAGPVARREARNARPPSRRAAAGSLLCSPSSSPRPWPSACSKASCVTGYGYDTAFFKKVRINDHDFLILVVLMPLEIAARLPFLVARQISVLSSLSAYMCLAGWVPFGSPRKESRKRQWFGGRVCLSMMM